MTWGLVISAYLLLVCVYCLGHSLGYTKGRRDAWKIAQHLDPSALAFVLARAREERP